MHKTATRPGIVTPEEALKYFDYSFAPIGLSKIRPAILHSWNLGNSFQLVYKKVIDMAKYRKEPDQEVAEFSKGAD